MTVVMISLLYSVIHKNIIYFVIVFIDRGGGAYEGLASKNILNIYRNPPSLLTHLVSSSRTVYYGVYYYIHKHSVKYLLCFVF